jgi:hypothetical protein
MSIEKAIAEELTLSYMQAGRSITGENVVIVAQSLARALDFCNEQEVHDVFKRARDMADVPTQMVLKQAMQNHRAENASQATYITYGTSEDKRPVTKEEKDYIYAWWYFHGTRASWLTDEQARKIIDDFESNPKHREFVNYQNGWTHVAADNMMKHGAATMRTRL